MTSLSICAPRRFDLASCRGRVVKSGGTGNLSAQRCQARSSGQSVFLAGSGKHASRSAAVAALHFIDLGVQPDFTQPYLNFAHYGNQLKQNKSIVADAAKNSGATEEQRALMMAIAMQESAFMNERDDKKDNDGKSKNCSILNLSLDLVEHGGYNNPDECDSLNHGTQHLDEAMGYLKNIMDQYQPRRALDFVRGGCTALHDGTSYDAEGYRKAIATIYEEFRSNPQYMSDDTRLEIVVPYMAGDSTQPCDYQ